MYLRGLVAAAARLRGGIGLGGLRGEQNKKKEITRQISSSIFDHGFMSRRYSTTTSMAMQSTTTEEAKSLHLCFCEHIVAKQHCNRDVVRSIKLSDLLSPTTTAATTRFEHETYHDSKFRGGNPFPWGCGRFGSHIVFAGGSLGHRDSIYNKAGATGEIVTFDANSSSPKPTFKAPRITRPRKHHYQFPIALLEVDGKLYCLDTRNQQYYSSAPKFIMRPHYHHYTKAPPAFAVLDPEGDGEFQAKWSPLESPPPAILYDDKSHKLKELMYCVVETKILVWNADKAGVYYFDVSRPEKGWIELHSPLASSLPFVKGCWGDTAKLPHHHGSGGTLIFTFDCTSRCKVGDELEPHQIRNNIGHVQVLLMSDKLDYLQTLKPLLQLPEIPPEFHSNGFVRPDGPTECCLVHLGDNKVCLILHKYFYELEYDHFSDWSDSSDLSDSGDLSSEGSEPFDPHTGRNKGILHLMTFEYQVTDPDLDVMEYRLLTTRNYEYYTQLPDDEHATFTNQACLTKAFVI